MRCRPKYTLMRTVCLFIAIATVPFPTSAAPGDWPEPRQNPHLTTVQPLAGAMEEAPAVLARIEVSPSRPGMTAVPSPDGSETWGLCIVGGALHCFNTQGEQKWLSHPPGLNFTSVVAAEDLDLDGRIEIALKAGRTADPYSAAVLVALEDGELLWIYDVEPMSYAWYLHIEQLFPEKDSKQIIVLMQGYPPDAENGYITLFDFEQPGEPPVQQWRYPFHDYTCFPTLLHTDLEGDGIDELAVQTHSRMWLLDSQTGDVKQFIGWDVSPGNNRSYGLVKFVDLNDDGLKDFLCIADFSHHHEVLLNNNGKMEIAWVHGWPDETVNRKIVSTWPEPPHADVDGDAHLEIITSMYNSEENNIWLVRVYDALAGDLIYRVPGAVAFAVHDVDRDGNSEIAVNLSTDPTKTVWDGAQLLRVVNRQIQTVWEDADATFLRPSGNEKEHFLRFTRGGEIFALIYEESTGLTEVPSPAITTPGPDFSLVPAIRGTQYPTLLAADLTGDGRNEVLIYNEPVLKVVAINDDGTSSVLSEYQSSGLPAFADLDGDGYLEIVTGEVSMTATPILVARTPALGNRLLWRSVFPEPDRSGLPWTMTKFYVRSGRFTGKETPDLYVWAGIPLVRSTLVDGLTGEIVWEKGETTLGRYWGPTHQPAAVDDYDGDGNEDLVCTIPDYYCIIDGPTGKFIRGPYFPPSIFNQPS
ncbi:MAG: VCBS repeat-containing protein, partial [bacterium]